MANYNNLKAGIDAVIKTNGRQEISGAALNTQLKNMITELGAGYQYMGVATPATNPGTPDANVFYLASEAGTYTNFGGIVINEGEVCALVWNGTWTKQVTGAATVDQVNQLSQESLERLIQNTRNYSVAFVDINNTTYNPYPLGATIPANSRTIVKVLSSVDIPINRIQFAFGEAAIERSDFICSGVSLVAGVPQYFKITTTHEQSFIVLRANATFVGTLNVVVANLEQYNTQGVIDTEAEDVINSHNIVSDSVTLTSQSVSYSLSGYPQFKKKNHTYLLELTADGKFQVNLSLSTGASSSTIVQTIGVFQGTDRLFIRYTPTEDFDRLFFGPPISSLYKEITFRLVDISEYKDISNLYDIIDALATQTSEYTDKSEQINWISGGYVADNGYVISSDGYAYAELDVNKGDILIGTYALGLALNRNSVYRVITTNDSKYYIQEQRFLYGAANIIFYIAENDIKIAINKRLSSSAANNISWYSANMYKRNQLFADRALVRYPLLENSATIQALSYNAIVGGALAEKFICLMHFSDIHGNVRNIVNIKEFRDKFLEFGLNDVICTGDMSGMRFPDYHSDLWDSAGYNHILLAIGNHDVYDHNGDAEAHGAGYDDRAYWATAQEKYEQYIAPNVANWGVVQPQGAGESGYYPCYYYKDYDTTPGADNYTVSAVRMIVLDCMAFDATQLAWLVSVLDDAKTNGYHVIIANHFVPAETQSDADYDGFDTPFNSLDNEMIASAYGLSYLPGLCDAVDSFINDGGVFICHLCGHMHYDLVGKLVSHPNQMYIAVGSANCGKTWQDTPRIACTQFEDLFNLISVDVHNKRLSVVRMGADLDLWMRHRKTMTLDYNNRTLVNSF